MSYTVIEKGVSNPGPPYYPMGPKVDCRLSAETLSTALFTKQVGIINM